MAGRFQPPPLQGQKMLDAAGNVTEPWLRWFRLVGEALSALDAKEIAGIPVTTDAPADLQVLMYDKANQKIDWGDIVP